MNDDEAWGESEEEWRNNKDNLKDSRHRVHKSKNQHVEPNCQT